VHHKDHRDWSKYNNELVVKGEYYLDLGFSEHWYEELEEMNKGKRGAPYKFPNQFVNLMAAWHQLVDYSGGDGNVAEKLLYVFKKCLQSRLM